MSALIVICPPVVVTISKLPPPRRASPPLVVISTIAGSGLLPTRKRLYLPVMSAGSPESLEHAPSPNTSAARSNLRIEGTPGLRQDTRDCAKVKGRNVLNIPHPRKVLR